MNNKIAKTLCLFVTLGLALTGCDGKSTASPPPPFDLTGSKQGQAVAFLDFDGDGIEDKAVGAPYALSSTIPQTGAVLIYSGLDSGFSDVPTGLLSGGDTFGFSLATIGDVNKDGKADFAVSAIHGDGADLSLCGSVTIYQGGGEGRIIASLSGESPMNKFGYAVASGDLNGDGNIDIIVSAPFRTTDPALYQSGAVYVFFGPDFVNRQVVAASSTNRSIGLAVAAGDLNNDGIDELLFSASGKVLVYFGNTDFAPSIDAPDISIVSTASGFGKAIVVLGDLDGNGTREIAVGAPNAVINLYRDTGSLYIISGSAGGTVNVSAATPPAALLVRIDGEGLFHRFGTSLVSLGDVDDDGRPDFAVSAPMADVTMQTGQNTLSGKVYFFRGKDISSSSTIANATVFPGMVKNQGYGTSLAASASGRLLIGAPRSSMDTGGVAMVDPLTGQTVAGGSSGGATGGSGDCH